jgi:hypothetical protein
MAWPFTVSAILASLGLTLAPGNQAACAIAGVHELHASRGGSARTYGTHHVADFESEFSYAVIEPRNHTVTGSTNDRDRKVIQRLLETSDRDVLWFDLRGRHYVVRDRATVAEVEKRLAPMRELGERQGRLGAEQGTLGGRQARIGGRQARIGARQGLLGARLALASLGLDDERRRRAGIEREMEELGRQQDELARQQEPLARKQEELGRRQSDLGREMERLSARVGLSPGPRWCSRSSLESGKHLRRIRRHHPARCGAGPSRGSRRGPRPSDRF